MKTSAFEESPGVISSNRVMFVLANVVFFGCLIYATWKAGEMVDIPEGWRWLIGLIWTGKVGQRLIESKETA